MALQFNGYGLQVPLQIITSDIDHLSAPTNSITMTAVPHANRSTITNAEYQSKTITLKGQIVSNSFSGIESLMDNFKAAIVGQDLPLDIDYGGSTRRYIATPTTVSVTRPNGLLFANFQIVFSCASPYGVNTFESNIGNFYSQTSGANSMSCYPSGTAPIQSPRIVVNLNSITYNSGQTTGTIYVGNGASYQNLGVTRAWAANDTLIVNSATKIVTVNGNPVDFVGAFPEFGTSYANVIYNDNFANRNYNLLYYQTTRYL